MVEVTEKFDRMSNEKKGQLIDSINDALKIGYGGGGNVVLSDDVMDNDLNMKVFLSEYVRTDDEVFDGMIEACEISCPIEFLDIEAIIDADNDYLSLIDGLHLNVYWIFENDIDELLVDKVLVEL